jgi:prephenate dehydrogenase
VRVGIVGLGLIGGSLAKAYSQRGHTVYAIDTDRAILDFALISGAVHGILDGETMKLCELILIAAPPRACIEYLSENAGKIARETFVIDCCGTKESVCAAGFRAAEQGGFTFVGGHPMAGVAHSGFKHSKANMFKGASMVVVPPVFDDILLLERVKTLLEPLELGRLSVTTAKKHDELIAFTSQMPHIISNAFIKSPTAKRHRGFSAGSYKDLTRVAWLDENLWAELFLENRESLSSELDILINELTLYRDAIADGDGAWLRRLLADGRVAKEEIDNKTN